MFSVLRRAAHASAAPVTLALLAACGGATTMPVTYATPGSAYALMDPGATTAALQQFAALPSVDGLAFRVLWSQLEPAAGAYDWTALDTAFAVVRQQGKMMTIHVGPTSVGLPGWLGPLGMASYTYTDPHGTHTDPVPWDDVYLSNYRTFVAALGAHIQATGNMNLVAAVSDPLPETEMSIPGCQDGRLAGSVPYDRGQYLAAWQSTISAYANAFPGIRLFVSAPLSFICLNDGNDGRMFYSDVMGYARSVTSHAAVFAADLNALGSQRLRQLGALAGQATIGLQTIWSYSDDPSNRMQGSLADAVCQGWNAGARYVEIYQADLSNADPAVQAAIGSARTGHGC